MKVILDVNRPSSLSCGVQSCSSVEGFLELERLHPEDEFVIDPASIEAFLEYQERLALDKVKHLCENMCITKQDYDVMIDFYQNVEPSPDPVHDEELFIDELLAADYYAELQEAYNETIWSLKLSF